MKIEKFRELHRDELERKLHELQDSLFKLRVKVQTKQVENTALLSSTRRDIARVLTLLRQMDAQGVQAPLAAAQPKAAEEVKAAPEPVKAEAKRPKASGQPKTAGKAAKLDSKK
jgi:large subunit ribosomal protein L29